MSLYHTNSINSDKLLGSDCHNNFIMIETTISLKEEETVLQIIAEVGSNKYIDLDEELKQIICRGEAEIEAQY